MAADEPVIPAPEVQVVWAMRRATPHGLVIADNAAPCRGLVLVVRGELVVRGAESSWTVPAQSVFLRSAQAPLSFEFAPGGEYLSVGLRAMWLDFVDLMDRLEAPQVWRPAETDAMLLASCLGELADTAGRDDPAARLIRAGLAQAVVGVTCRALAPAELAPRLFNSPPWLTAALLAAEASPGATVAELAHAAAYSDGQFRRLFAAQMGLSPQDWLQARRFSAARQWLEATDLSIGAIADRLGFACAPHFTRFFKLRSGLSPREYRRRAGTPV